MATNKELITDNLRETHWLGEVVDNEDPAKLGRCRIKVYGKFDQLETENIPWATPMNRDVAGAHFIPRIGDILAVRFDNGNIYHPEYWFQINQNKELKEDILDSSDEAHNVISLIYDAERNVRIWWSPENGLTMNTGADKDTAPSIRFSNDGEIFLYSDNIYIATESDSDTNEPAVRGDTLSKLLSKMLGFIKSHKHTTPNGPSGPAMPPESIQIVQTKGKLDGNNGEGFIKQIKI